MTGYPRSTSAILLCLVALILAAGVAVPARAADNAAPALENAAGAPAPAPAPASDPPAAANNGDTAWLLVSAALVMFMTPGLALFYGGMVRRKNVLGTVVQSFIVLGLISVEWV
ncbi:MAG: ammonium transporter, partial [Deltaproteobacteria bacterium]|nr:ammonium transporter [Deltaproteobacteria bacterium]